MVSIDYTYLRPKKAAALKNLHEQTFIKKTDLQVLHEKDATILPLRPYHPDNKLFGYGGVINSSGAYVPLSSVRNRVQHAYPFEKTEYRNRKVVYCGYLVNHWGHFLIEAVARLWYTLHNDESIDAYVFFLNENEERIIKGNFKEFLVLLGIWDRIEIINKPVTYREVVIPELGYAQENYYSEQYLNIFKRIAERVCVDPDWKTNEKIYFSRSQLKNISKREQGLDALDDFFHRNGYAILYPERMSLSEMIFQLQNAKSCATLSGSLPHNMLFATNQQSTIIVERCVNNNEIQVDINRMKELNVIYVDANIPIYTVNTSGPFIMAYNDQLQAFAKDHHMFEPDKRFTSDRFKARCFINYMKAYQKEYHYRWFMEEWYVYHIDYLVEAYQAGFAYYSDYLSGKKPFFLHHCFELHYIKQFIKRLLGRSV